MNLQSYLLKACAPLLIVFGLLSTPAQAGNDTNINYQPVPIELAANQQLNVYYFHGNARCTTCKKMERYTVNAMQQGYASQLEQGQVNVKITNLEQSQNYHYIQDFELITRAVVLEIEQDGKPIAWRRLDEVWNAVTSEQRFTDYIYAQIGIIMLGENHG
ncbi:nitrophenyl compound nitroreductase subunit ArsF family protein [Ferrimonas lipolytica]|uniref:Uncharacterized protein n=1 Tax=Ferrimonas lipolytica TaxID=2724191 RepID=A0A6H1UG05_9GAMM|nr:nitrophenyl compound nitroreductase subunit ArsF family protein [Ferrimonas lipolytica]QIZ77559.1 hypothetical protein HER31_12050 [Ferrimonas lipolytica]